ncbi:Mss4-like protein [Phellopilus nigrolimitatus]|nr:Mss4-like protein [Phellopilus nigrolimitatus]
MTPTYHGSCLCGEVNFEVHAEPILVTCCHCKNCKKYTGTVFTTNVVFPADTVNVTKGAPLVRTFHDSAQDSGNALLRRFCGLCSAPLYNSNAAGPDAERTLAVFYSALDDFPGAPADVPVRPGETAVPRVEYYGKDRAAWVRPVDGAEQVSSKYLLNLGGVVE